MKKNTFIIFVFLLLPHINAQSDSSFLIHFEDCEPIINSLIDSIGQDLPSRVLMNAQGYYYIESGYKVVSNINSNDLEARYNYNICNNKKINESIFLVYINELSLSTVLLMINQWDEQLRNMGAKIINIYREDSGDTIEYELNGYNIHFMSVTRMARISISIVKDERYVYYQ